MKILYYDVETSPIIAPVWGLWENDVYYEHIIIPWHIISAAYAWNDGPVTGIRTSRGLQPDKDKEVVKELYEQVAKADIIIAHNNDKFDQRKLSARALFHNLKPIPPVKTIDTLKVAKKYFKLDSNRLDYIGEHLGLGRKLSTPKGLWLRAIASEIISNPHLKKKEKEKIWRDQEEAIAEMDAYCQVDVELLRNVYKKMRPFIQNHPNANVIGNAEGVDVCPNCSSEKLQKRGFHFTRTGAKQRYCCRDCGAWSSSGTSIRKADVR